MSVVVKTLPYAIFAGRVITSAAKVYSGLYAFKALMSSDKQSAAELTVRCLLVMSVSMMTGTITKMLRSFLPTEKPAEKPTEKPE